MNLAIVHSRANVGIQALAVSIEVHLANGVPSLSIVGLPTAAVKESKDRVRSAILTSHYEFPIRRVTINLAPADLPKEGGRFDLPVALGVLAASGQIPNQNLSQYEFAGELALSGEVRSIKGVIPHAIAAREAGRILVIPEENAAEAALVSGITILPARHLLEICAHITGRQAISPYKSHRVAKSDIQYPDMADVRGQQHAKRALMIAAAGQHSLLMVGPPGTGKTMLASRLIGLLPPMAEDEALEHAAVMSIIAIRTEPQTWRRRPFRAPHHTASSVALVGGGKPPKPGEISLSHHGVLFLDELPEFSRGVLESLREPLESGTITISRAAQQAEFPAKFQLVAAMNPCPCGHLGNPKRHCQCSADQVARYRARISGPLLDRIDLQVDVPLLPFSVLRETNKTNSETSEVIKERVCAARQIQLKRSSCLNNTLSGQALQEHCALATAEQVLLDKAMERFNLSARSYHRILRVARTIADIEASPSINKTHLSEALSYRCFDKGRV